MPFSQRLQKHFSDTIVGTFAMSCRKRRRLEDLPHSQTVEKFADLIGRGKISIDAAATIARSFVARLMFFTEQRLKNPPVLGGSHFSFKPSSRFENNRLCGRWPTLRGSRTKRFAPLDRLAPMDAVRRTKKGTYTRGSDICGVFLWKHMWCPWIWRPAGSGTGYLFSYVLSFA